MTAAPVRPFSIRHKKVLKDKTIKVSLPRPLRARVWKLMERFDHEDWYQPDPLDNWQERSTVTEETKRTLEEVYGVDVLEAFTPPDSDSKGPVDLKGFILGAYPDLVLDSIEMFESRLTEDNDWRATFRQEINEAFEDHKCPWRLSDGQFFRIDIEFMEAVVVERTEEIFKAEGLQGPHEEFREARDDLTGGDYKGAITNACKAFESTLKAILNREEGNARELLDAFVAEGFCDDTPEKIRRGFRDQVLKALPFLRNKLGAHGQGNDVIQVPKAYAQLAVHLAGSFIQFVISQGTAHKAEDNGPFIPEDDDDVPF